MVQQTKRENLSDIFLARIRHKKPWNLFCVNARFQGGVKDVYKI